MNMEAGQNPAFVAYEFIRGNVHHENTIRAYAAGRRYVPYRLATLFA
jgi:hypothetical protein